MEVYILKSAACLTILFLFYKLALENTALHSTKRVYLLASLIISLLIPCITFTQYIEVAPVAQFVSEGFIFPLEDTPTIEKSINYLPYILGTVYALGVLFFGFRFGKNLYSLAQKIKHNPLIKEKSIWYVLLQLPVTPHSFFNYIFFDKEAYEGGNIPEEVLVHEQAHVTQKHSWDILFFEIFQIVFWFNPLLFFFKRSIKLNHEFLADRTVLQTGAELSSYQNILLDFSSKSSVPAMAHSINYSSIKKRFNVMKTHTSKRAAWLKGLLVLPLLGVLIYGFSATEVVEKPSQLTTENFLLEEDSLQERLTARSISIKILEKGLLLVDGIKTTHTNLYSVLGTLHTDISKKHRDRIINIHVSADGDIPYNDLLHIQKVATAYGYHRIVTPKEEIIRSKGNVPMASEAKTVTHKDYAQEFAIGATQNGIKTFLLQIEVSELRLNGIPVKLNNFAKAVDKYTRDWEETDYTSIKPQVFVAATPKAFLDKVDAEFRKTHFSKANGGMDIVPPPPPPPPLPPKVKMGEESSIPPPPPPTSKKVMKGEKSNIPPPPPSNMGDITKKFNYSYVLYVNGETIYLNSKKVALSKFAKAMDKHTKNWPVSAFKKFGVSTKKENTSDDFIEKLNTEYRKTQLAKNSSSKNPYLFSEMETGFIPTPPTPPEKKNPIDHIITMAKRDATFFFEKKSITSDQAIDLIKVNKSMHLQTHFNDPNPPAVYISKSPISNKEKTKYETIETIKAMKEDIQKKGYFLLNGETFYYVKKGIDIKYFNRWGNLVNEKGEKITPN